MIVNRYPQVDEDAYHVRMLQYKLAQQLWLVRKYTYDSSGGAPDSENVTPVLMREFRYDGDRQRYLERTHVASDFSDDPDLGTWHDYLGNAAWTDYYVLTVSSLPTLFVLATHDYGLGLVRTLDTSGTKYFHADMLGSTRLITNSSGVTTATLNYTAFGELQPVGSPALSQGTRYGFAGAWGYQNDAQADADNDIGLLHVGARYYDPSTGRFVMRDPIGIGGGINVYSYVKSKPTTRVDPAGHEENMTGLQVATSINSLLVSMEEPAVVQVVFGGELWSVEAVEFGETTVSFFTAEGAPLELEAGEEYVVECMLDVWFVD